jgi:acyl-CoA reductase-like NAD-dependent aldehyde dehydrogenase
VFGPAVPILRAANADEAVSLANDTRYGLGSNVWTSALKRGQELALRLDAGHTAIDGMTGSDPRLPFGGVKDSAMGESSQLPVSMSLSTCTPVVVEETLGPDVGRAAAE